MTISELYEIYEKDPIICTDSRNIKKNGIFFALKGEKFNGNKFAVQAIEDGCKYAIIDEEKYNSNNCILVDNVKSTLQNLAEYHRNQLEIPIIGITGSNGKTTTKELTNSVLSAKYNCYYTKGNLNNQIGLPLSILEITKSHEIAIIEMGASEIGEIKNLCRIAKPTAGIITNIGKAHLEGFGSLEGVIKAKTELYDFLKKNNGVQFVNGDDRLLVKKSRRKNRIIYGKETNSNFFAQLISSFPFVSIKIKDTKIESHLVGKFQYDNIVAASCIGSFYNVSLENIKKSIESYIPKNNRTELIESKNNHIILDAYNANPSSMESMIESFIKLDKQNKMCILGEMRELGSYSEKEHLKLIKKMKTSGIESIFIGEEYLSLITEYKWTWKYNNWNIDPKDIVKLQKDKMHMFSDTSSPFSMIRSIDSISTRDKKLISNFENKDHIVLSYYPSEDSNNDTILDSVNEDGVKAITDLMKKEFDFKLIKTLKGKINKNSDNIGRNFYLVYKDGDPKLTKDWVYGEGDFSWRRSAMAACGDIHGATTPGRINDDLELVDDTDINNIKNNIFLSTADLIENISNYNIKNRTILIKGSRGLKLENLVKHL